VEVTGRLSRAARYEVTRKCVQAYADAPRKGTSVILDRMVELTGWNQDYAHQQVRARLRQPTSRAAVTVAMINRRKMRAELPAMNTATTDRYLAPVKASSPIRGKTTTQTGSLLRTSITTQTGRRRGGHRARFRRGRYLRPLRPLAEGRDSPVA